MSTFVVIDTETTWTDDVMSIGAVIADSTDFSVIDSRYYLIDPAFRYGGMYSGCCECVEHQKKSYPPGMKWQKICGSGWTVTG